MYVKYTEKTIEFQDTGKKALSTVFFFCFLLTRSIYYRDTYRQNRFEHFLLISRYKNLSIRNSIMDSQIQIPVRPELYCPEIIWTTTAVQHVLQAISEARNTRAKLY